MLAVIDHDFSPMDHPVMRATQRDQIGKLGLAAVSPVFDVMSIDISMECAPRKPAAGIARLQRAAQRRRNAPRLAAHIERLAVAVLENANEARRVDMYHDLIPVRGTLSGRTVLQVRLGDQSKSLRAARAVRSWTRSGRYCLYVQYTSRW